MGKIKVIFFDIGGVYCRESGACAVMKASNLTNRSFEDVLKIFHEIWKDFGVGNVSPEEYYSFLSSELGIDTGTLAEIWTDDELFVINPDVESLIVELKKRNYTVASITDVDPIHTKIRTERGIYNAFEFVIDSISVRAQKKFGKVIYEKALEMAKTEPEECIMIDDTPEKLVPAKELGMHTILFMDAGQLKKELMEFGVEI
ncbi:MAG: hypothetical protein QT00_C0002G0254 [archaeon GW2011_AR5]|nr:MAG: hypothetical protein QT00_C0002G0254 [archaeon GW2011_AR5]